MEDDSVIVELLREILGVLGLEAVIAENAYDAISEFAESVANTVCVILDYGIPGMDASRLLAKLRDINPEIKVVLSSGYSSSFIARDFPLSAVSAFIAKPYEPLVLVEMLKRIVEQPNQ